MSLLFKAVCLTFTGTVVILLLKKTNPEFAPLLVIAATGAVVYLFVSLIGSLADFVSELSQLSQISPMAISIVLKTVAVSMVTQFGAQLCRDSGQATLASCLETAGTLTAIYIALPLMNSVINMIKSLI